MNIRKREIGKCVVLDCKGKITLGPATMAVRNAIRETVEAGAKRIILNLGEVSYIDSSGIGELVSNSMHVISKGGKLDLLNLTKRIKELLVIARLLTAFDVYEDEQKALTGC